MIKRTFSTIILMLIFISASIGQATVSLGTVTASPGENISVPINVTNFTGIGAITFKIRFNPGLLNYSGISNSASSDIMASATDSTINITYFSNSGAHTFSNGLLLNLNFNFIGVSSSQLSFLNNCEVTQGLSIIYPTYTGGAVNTNTTNAAKVTILGANATSGANVTVPVKFEGFPSNVGAITQKIKYDNTKLSFVNISTLGSLTGANANASNGIITITWTNTNGAGFNFPTDLINLNFVYTGSNATNLEFYSGSLITNNSTANIAVSYFNGTITPNATSASVTLGSYVNAIQGQDFEIPLNFAGFSTTLPNSIAAITLQMNFDNTKLAFIGVSNNTSNANISSNGNTINLTWTSTNITTAVNINGDFLKLKFKYLGIGNANVNFGSGCVLSNTSLTNVAANYTASTISPAASVSSATLGFVQATQGNQVIVPLNFSGLPANMGAATLVLNYDVSKLTYIGVDNNIFGASVQAGSPNKITIAWNAASATNINGTFLNLKFIYNCTTSDCDAYVNFVSGSELADFTLATINSNWNNGGVNFKFNVSGILKYANTTGGVRPITNTTIKLKSGANEIANTTSDATGSFTFVGIPNGTYTYEVICTKPWSNTAVNLTDYAIIRSFVNTGTPILNGIFWLAADVNNSNSVNLTDYALVRNRVNTSSAAGWSNINWIFDLPIVIVSGANVSGQSINGILRGDVNANYIP